MAEESQAPKKQTAQRFSPFTSCVAPGFWQKLYDKLLDNEKDDRTISGANVEEADDGGSGQGHVEGGPIYENNNNVTSIPIWGYFGPPTFRPQYTVFTVDATSFKAEPPINSKQYATAGKLLITNSAQTFKDLNKNTLLAKHSFCLDNVEKNPAELVSFIILCYADLKNYVFTYWFGFPTISSIESTYFLPPEKTIFEHKSYENVFENGEELIQNSNGFFAFDVKSGKLKTLSQVETGMDVEYCFIDPSGYDDVPGWVARNFIAYIVKKMKPESGTKLRINSIRPVNSKLPTKFDYVSKSRLFEFKVKYPIDWESNPKILGWEKVGSQFIPQSIDLKSNLDPVALSESSVDFNLKLMKWRLFPEFDLDKMHNLKVCLLGAGTLGCNVARILMGWGIRRINLIDGGRVSYSNPVRQSLFTYKDTGEAKAAKAAANLKAIFPGIEAVGYKLFVPMPGHPPINLEKTKSEFNKLVQTIKDCDVIYLLTDTRESRWLPTVLGAVHNKLVINAALGFDSYVVMRHGRKEEDLGCYFCTDIVVPGNSTVDRTLDQQCTVSRPGISMIAAGLAVELMTSVLYYSAAENDNITLGVPAHSQRGFLSSGLTISPKFQKFDKCSACSDKVQEEFIRSGFEFVLSVMENPKVLEKVAGLDELSFGTDGIVELEDDEDA